MASPGLRTLVTSSCVPSIRKLQSQSAAVWAELVKVFGANLQFDVETDPQSSASQQAVVIALGVLLALSMLGLIIITVIIIR